MGGGGDGGASEMRAEEAARQQRIREGTEQVNQTFDSQFNDSFFDGRSQAYTNYATPQLQQQYQDAQKQLTYALARSGQLDSSVRAQRESDLTRLYDQRATEIANQAQDYENQSRNSVEDARSSIISQLNASGDAEQAARDATNRATSLTQPDSYSAVSDLFGTFVQGLGAQYAQERSAALSGGFYRPAFNTGLYSPRSGSVTVRN